MSCLENAKQLQQMMAVGQAMEAFEKFYADDVVIVEKPTGEVRNGKEAQRKAIQDWFASVEERHGGGVGAITSNEDDQISCAETWFDLTFKVGNRMKMEEVAVQEWKDGLESISSR